MDEKEKRVRAITRIYYTNINVQKALFEFSKGREVVPRYYEGFGKRPDIIQYPSDITNLAKKGATSFHCSEEIWNDPMQLSSETTQEEMKNLRKGWDLLIDVDSKYLDVSKILAILIIEELERYGIRNYGIKFSGSKGFHIIVGNDAFPEEFEGAEKKESFPDWPRAVCEFLTFRTRREFNKKVGELFGDTEKFSDERSKEALCPKCGKPANKGRVYFFECPVCKTTIQRKNIKLTKKRLKCVASGCGGVLDLKEEKDYFICENCDLTSISKKETSGRYTATFTEHAKKSESYSKELKEEISGNYFGASDLVLVAPRHLFRMPYSLHEKTSLASVVIERDEIGKFLPKDADAMKVKIKNFMPKNEKDEGRKLLIESLSWKRQTDKEEKKEYEKKYFSKDFEEINFEKVDDSMFPPAIKKLLTGLEDGKKRGLFVLITFLRNLNFPPSEIYRRVDEWNKKNKPPLKEGYVRSQIEWHIKQRKKILPPNYSNDAFYRDIGLLQELPKTKNPLVDVKRRMFKPERN